MYKIIIIFILLSISSALSAETKIFDKSSDTRAFREQSSTKSNGKQRRIALVIGNDDYQTSPLSNAVNDAVAMKNFLESRNFKVIFLKNGTTREMREKIGIFIDNVSKDSVGLVYYSGHGTQEKSRVHGIRNYLIPVNDTRIKRITDLDEFAISLDYILNPLMEKNNGLNIVMLDACRTSMRAFSKSRLGGLAPSQAQGVYIAYATASNALASDNGLFRKSFIKHASKSLRLIEIFEEVKLDVYNKTGQNPFTSNGKRGKFYFTLPPKSNRVKFSQNKVGMPPKVKILTNSLTMNQNEIDIAVEICEQDGGVGNITFYIDNKPLRYIGKTLKTMKGCAILEQRISVPKGKHTIGVDATNQEGYIISNKATVTITNDKSIQKKPNLHLLTISINDYKDNSLNLRFSNKDANAISSKFKEIGKPIFKNIYTYSLKDAQVTRWQMKNKFKEIAQNINVNDVFILYISGHGISNQIDGNYYFIPYDCPNGADITKKAISQHDFMELMSQIKAVKSVILLDTCESGTLASKDLVITSVNRFGGNVGSAIIAGVSSTQNAIDGYKQHGVFTYTVLDAMSNKKAYSFDGKLSINEMAEYVRYILPKISKKAFNHEQKPTIYMNGDTTFSIGGL